MDVDSEISVSAGLEEAEKGIIAYMPRWFLAYELEDLWDPRPDRTEEEVCLMCPAPEFGAAAPMKRPPPWFIGMSSAFSKDIAKIDRKLQGRILEALVEITDNPMQMRGDTVKPLVGDLKGCWRYRLGDYQIIYSPDRNTGDVTLLAFDARGSAYAA